MMKRILLALLFIPTLAGAAQQEITVVPDDPVIPSIGSLKTAINLRLADIDENFDELYPAVSGKETALGNPASDGYVLSSTAAGVRSWIEMTGGAGDDLGSAVYSDVVALWTTCTGYLKSDGTCDTPSGSATYPSAAGVANWGGSAWGTSYTVGTGASNLVQLNASAQLPAVSADLLTITDTGTYFTTDTVGAALQELGGAPELLFGTEFTETAGTGTVTVTLDYPVTSETYGSSWFGDTEGAQRDDIYAILNVGDTDDDGLADKLDLAAAGLVKTDASGVISTATAGTDYLLPTGAGGSLTVTATGFDGQLATTDDTLQEIAQKFDDLTVPAAGIGGSTGSTDNAILRANGTGGSTAQASGVTIDDNDNVSTTGTLSGKMATVVNSDTASYSVTTAHARAGTLFLTTNTATTTYTLPAAEAGMTACFSMGQGNSQVLRIDTDGTDYIVMSTRARTSAAGDYYGATASATNKVCVAAYDASDWYVESEVGTWTEE